MIFKSLLSSRLLLIVVIINSSVFAVEMDNKKILNLLMDQKVIVHKIVKNYTMFIMDMQYKNPKKSFEDSMTAYGENKLILNHYAEKNTLNGYLKCENEHWLKLSKAMELPSIEKSSPLLNIFLNESVSCLDKNIFLLHQSLDIKHDNMMFILEEAIVLAYEINAYYMLNGWKKDTQTTFKLQKNIEQFDDLYKKIVAVESIGEQHFKILKKTMFFIKIKSSSATLKFTPALFDKKINLMIKSLEELAMKYTKN